MRRCRVTSKLFPERLYDAGITDLVSVIPPGAQLTPLSKIPQNAIGKIPGRRLDSGLWAGYNWRKDVAVADDVRRWCNAGANVGLRADHFPAVDIDCKDATLVTQIADKAFALLGPAPARIGRAPKALLMYRTDEPFGRMRLWIVKPNGDKDLVEILGEGQQYLVYGIHPGTGMPYVWEQDPIGYNLVTITAAGAKVFLDALEAELSLYYRIEREGDGKRLSTLSLDQDGLLAPTVEVVRSAVAVIPNTDALFPTRTDYLKIGYAIKAACGAANDADAYEIFLEWASRWDAGYNDPEDVLADWRRMNGERKVGWNWLAEIARGYGFEDATLDFEAIEATPDTAVVREIALSHQGLAAEIVDKTRNVLRYVPQRSQWLVWDGARWRIDAELLAHHMIARGLTEIADRVAREGTTEKAKAKAASAAKDISSGPTMRNVTDFIRSNRSIAVSADTLDHDRWVLNTPAGLVNLRTGELGAPDPDALCTKLTNASPDFSRDCPEWKRFVAEATGDDAELAGYLQRLSGYALTGDVSEQQLAFLWGPGANGKSVFTRTLCEIMGDYAHEAEMAAFTASHNDKHTTSIAELEGKRLVLAEETEAGKRWDESLVKRITGGGKITARYMRQDNFSYDPQCKLLFCGNHKPEIRDAGAAMRRRMQLIPFTVTPKRVDKNLFEEKLRPELPAILAWMIRGCLAWQKDRLNPPAAVVAATNDYFEAEDALGRWVHECCVLDGEATATTDELFQSWREWTNRNNEFTGKPKGFVEALKSRKLARWTEPVTRRKGFVGIKVDNRYDPVGL